VPKFLLLGDFLYSYCVKSYICTFYKSLDNSFCKFLFLNKKLRIIINVFFKTIALLLLWVSSVHRISKFVCVCSFFFINATKIVSSLEWNDGGGDYIEFEEGVTVSESIPVGTNASYTIAGDSPSLMRIFSKF